MTHVEAFRSFLHSRSLRLTGVRSEIMKVILERKGHFDIGELVDTLRARGVDASRAAAGQEPHDHLTCTGCGTVVEFHFEAFEVLQHEVAEKYGFRLTGHLHRLLGLCRKCWASKKRKGRVRGRSASADHPVDC